MHDLFNAIHPTRGRLKRQPADAEVTRHHALAAHHLEDVEQFFAFPEAVEEHGHRAKIDRVSSQPHQMRADARQFGQQDANILRALGDFQPQKLFDRQAVSQVVRQRRKIVHPIGNRNCLGIGERLGGFLNPSVQITDVDVGLDYCFAIELQQNAQHTVRGRMLRAHIEDHCFCGTRGGLNDCHGEDSLIPKSARALHGIILAKGIAFPIVGQEHAPQIGMPFKAHAKQIEYLALVPICRRPNRHDTLNHRRLPRQADAQTQRIAPRNRKKVVI